MMPQRLRPQLSSTLGGPSPTPKCIPRCKASVQSRSRLACKAFADNGNGNGLNGSNGHTDAGLPLSMYTPYKQLPPEGEMVPAADIACDPTLHNCKTPIYTYESRCNSCCGTGFVKSNANGRRASLCTCLMCHGLGYVRRTTARFIPDMDPSNSNGVFTLARPESEHKEHKERKGPRGKASPSP